MKLKLKRQSSTCRQIQFQHKIHHFFLFLKKMDCFDNLSPIKNEMGCDFYPDFDGFDAVACNLQSTPVPASEPPVLLELSGPQKIPKSDISPTHQNQTVVPPPKLVQPNPYQLDKPLIEQMKNAPFKRGRPRKCTTPKHDTDEIKILDASFSLQTNAILSSPKKIPNLPKIRTVNGAFDQLRDYVPSGNIKKNKISKVETLRSAMEYIKALQDMLGIKFDEQGNRLQMSPEEIEHERKNRLRLEQEKIMEIEKKKEEARLKKQQIKMEKLEQKQAKIQAKAQNGAGQNSAIKVLSKVAKPKAVKPKTAKNLFKNFPSFPMMMPMPVPPGMLPPHQTSSSDASDFVNLSPPNQKMAAHFMPMSQPISVLDHGFYDGHQNFNFY